MNEKHSALHPSELIKNNRDVIAYLNIALQTKDHDLIEVACEKVIEVLRARDTGDEEPAATSQSATAKPLSAENYTYSAIWSQEDGEYTGLVEEIPGLVFLSPRKEHALQGVKAAVDKLIFMHQGLEHLLTKGDKSFADNRFLDADGAILRLQERYNLRAYTLRSRLSEAAKTNPDGEKLRYKGITTMVKYDAWEDRFYGKLDVEDGPCWWDAYSEEEIIPAFNKTVELYLRDTPHLFNPQAKEEEKLRYKGITSTPKYSIPDRVIYGKLDLDDTLFLWESETLEGVESAFHEAVDDHIEMCAEDDKEE